MEENQINKILKDLDGISYLEWTKLQFQINHYFEAKRKEHENNFKLDSKAIKRIIQSQFE